VGGGGVLLLVGATQAYARQSVSALKEKILRLIRAQGPISVAQYMQIALGDPEGGYYMRANPIGRDFITAPEVSQIFGELIGLFFLQAWEDHGRPGRFQLVELGPGRGTLMADMLRAAKIRPAFLEAAEINLVEMSPALRAVQAETLAGFRAEWRSHMGEVPKDAPLFLIANEFFDALPARQFMRTERGWHERMVTADEDTLVFALTPAPVPADAIPAPLRNAGIGAVYEASPGSRAVMEEIGQQITRRGGAALFLD
jgi:SAM-dependent MidA family methyltransferase